MVTSKLMTADELAELPDDAYKYELIRGEVQRMAPAGGEHGEIAFEFGRVLGNHVVEHKLGQVYAAETGFLLAKGPDTVLAPDIAFVRADRLPPKHERIGFPHLPPDLVVEVVSPSDRASEVAEKVALYHSLGVAAVWVIEPRLQTVTLYHAGQRPRILVAGDILDGGEIVPGFSMPVADLFQ